MQTPLHGYGIMQKAEKLSNGRVRLAAGTLYGAINTMLERGWISAIPGEKDSRKKEYQISAQVNKVLQLEIMRLEAILENGKNM